MITHIVMFSLKEDCSEADFQVVYDGLLNLPKAIPTIVKFQLGKDIMLPEGQVHPLGKNRQIMWTASFKSSEEYQIYDSHAEHKSFLKNILAPRLLAGSRAAIQFEDSSEG